MSIVRTRRPLRLLLPLSVALTAACAERTGESNSWTVRDSAGVEVVENLRPEWTREGGWRVDPVPATEIVSSPEHPLFNVIGVVRMNDGRIVVANQSSSQLLFFDGSGRLTGTAGRQGEGPGEFVDISHLVHCGTDSLIIYDRRTLRASVFAPDGTFVRSFPPPSLVEHAIWPQSVACSREGMMLVVGWGRNPVARAGPARTRRDVPVLTRRAGEDRFTQIGTFPGSETQDWTDATGSGWWGAAPFGRRTSIGLADSWIYVAVADAHEIQQYDPAGTLVRVIRWRDTHVPVSAAHVRAFTTALLDSLTDERRRLTEPLLQRVEYPEFLPPYGSVLADRSGHLWVERYPRTADDVAAWTVFSPEGRMLGSVSLPPDLSVREIGDDFVLAVAKDEFGAERVLSYRLTR